MNMEEDSLVATISGAALSFLFYENACSVGDQMGFLLGDVVTFVTKNVTDSERQIETVRKQIEITNILACSSVGEIFNDAGKLHKKKLGDFLRNKSKDVVGWFRFRHNNRLVPTFRDKIVHKELAKHFSEYDNQRPQKYFIACIVNATKTEKMGIHKFRHVLLRYEDGIYRPLPLKINNLGHEGGQTDGLDYMPKPFERTSQEPGVFAKFVESLKLDSRQKNGCELVSAIQRAAEKHVKKLIPIVCQSDREIFEMEEQVRELRSKMISKVFTPNNYLQDNQRIDTPAHHELMPMEEDQNLEMGFREDAYSKTKGSLRPQNSKNTIRSPSDTAQKSPSSRFNNSSASRRSTDDENMFD